MIRAARQVVDLRLAAVLIAGCAALAWRPPATVAGWGIILGVGVLSVILPLTPSPMSAASGRGVWFGAVAVGVAAFAAARMVAMHTAGRGTLVAMLVTALAAVAEEAFFRRLVYGWLARWGAGMAIAGAATVFAAVHIPAYGLWSIPVNLGAGILLGWQRWATGRWSSAAVTHGIANLLQMI